MSYLTFFTGANRIDIHYNRKGMEYIYYNGKLIAKDRSSSSGITHEFSVQEDDVPVVYCIRTYYRFLKGVRFDIYRNNAALLLS